MKRFLFILTFIAYYTFCIAQTIINPVFDKTDTPEFHVEKIELAKDTTYVFCTYSAIANSWANISPESYLEDVDTGKKYTIIKSEGLPYSPQIRTFVYAGKYNVVLYFPAIHDIGLKLNLIELPDGSGFNIYGISLSNQYERLFTEHELTRFINMSSFYNSAGDTIKAIQIKKNEVEATKYIHGIKSEAYLVSLLGLAIMYDKSQCFGESINLMETITKMHADIWGTTDKDYASQLRWLAQFYSHAGILDKSIETFKKSISLYESLNIFDNEYAFALSFISSDYSCLGDQYHAIEYRKKAIEVWKKLGNSEDYLQELEIMTVQGDFIARLDIVESELNHLPVFVDTTSVHFSIVLKALTSKLIYAGKYKEAMNYCNRNLSLLNKDEYNNKLGIAEALGYKCRISRRLGLYHEAITIGEMAKAICDSINTYPPVYCFILDDLAWCYCEYYDYEKAISHQEQLATIYEEKREWISLAGALGTLGEYYQYKENLHKAEEYIKKAIDVISSHNAEDIINTEFRRGEIAPAYYFNDLKLVKLHYHITKNSLLTSLAMVYYKNGKYSDAIQVQKESIKNAKAMDDNEMYSSGLSLLSCFYYYNNQFNESIKTDKEAISIMKDSLYYLNNKESLNINLAQAYESMAISYYKLNNKHKAIECLMQSIVLTEGNKNIDANTQAKIILSNIFFENKDYEKTEYYLSDALDYLINVIKKEISSMKSEQKQRMWTKYEYAFVKYRDIVEKGEWDGAFNAKLYNYTLFSKSLLLDNESHNEQTSNKRMTINWKDIQNNLSDNDLAIEFITTREDSLHKTYHALVIDKKCTYPNMITLYQESVLENIKHKNYNPIADIVGNLIWKPILVQYNHVSNIYFSPDGILHILPIEHCQVDGVGEMAEHYNLFRLSSTKEIVFQVKDCTKNNATLYGGLDYDLLEKEYNYISDDKKQTLFRSISERGGFDPLPSTMEELIEINDLLNQEKIPTTLYIGENGTEDSFKELSGKDINMLHLATHGMYVEPIIIEQKKFENNFNFLELIINDKDPVREDIVLTHSFLVMSGGNKLSRHETFDTTSDGILTALEISHIDFSKVDLVVLSACETGLGDITSEGVYGLQRGFKKAGANTILMSLDKVDDEATKILMVEFYRNLMSGKSKYQSLKEAQKHLRQVDNGKYDDPKYWASFIMLDGLN